MDWLADFPALKAWLIAVIVGLAIASIVYLAGKATLNRLRTVAERTSAHLGDAVVNLLSRTRPWFYLTVSFYFGAHVAGLPPSFMKPFRMVTIVLTFLQVGIWGNGLITFWMSHYRERVSDQDPSWATTVTTVGFVGRVVLWILVTLLALQNLGVNIDTLLAGLGIGGVAVALATQNILGDLFASLSIVLDKPFLIGDFITLDQFSGTVEHVGLKTTRIRSLTGEELVISNSDLLKSRIRNYKRMQERRVAFTLNVEYSTPEEKLIRIPEILREIIEAEEHTRFERAHFKEFGTYSLVFEVVYWVTVPDYMTYMDVQQRVNLAVMRRFKQEGIAFALPVHPFHLDPDGNVE